MSDSAATIVSLTKLKLSLFNFFLANMHLLTLLNISAVLLQTYGTLNPWPDLWEHLYYGSEILGSHEAAYEDVMGSATIWIL